MISSLFSGISGLSSNATAMGVLGDNIANVNTAGFKANRSMFADVLNQSLTLGGVAGSAIGRGVRMIGTYSLWTQGSLEATTSPTDLGINGRGFFTLKDEFNVDYYSRAGQFRFDKDGFLINPTGLNLQGWDLTDPLAEVGGPTQNIQIPGGAVSEPMLTENMRIEFNLDNETAPGETYSTTITVYDSLGNDIPVNMTFTRTLNPREWTIAGDIPATAGSGVAFSGGTVSFNADGSLNVPGADITMTLTLTNGATATQDITWDLYDDAGNSYGDVTGYSANSSTTFSTQDGYAAGSLQTVNVSAEGVITGVYNNGEIVELFQIALADFPSYQGLLKQGENLYTESVTSGQALTGTPGTGRLGTISASTVEQSNVDLATEFVKMITTQRAFQANSRVITTSDEILNELINIKR